MKNSFIFTTALSLAIFSYILIGDIAFSLFWLLVSVRYIPEVINDIWNLYILLRR